MQICTVSSINGKQPGLLQVSRRSVIHAGRVLSEDNPAVPALRRAVEQGRVRVSDASGVIDQPAEVQRKVLERVVRGESKNVAAAVKRVNDETVRQEDRAALESHRPKPVGETTTLHQSTVADLHMLVGAATVDAIVTNPPHTAEYLPVFSDLAAFAAHALKPEGVMVVMSGVTHLPEVLRQLTHPGLKWVCEFDYRPDGPPANLDFPHRVRLRRSPLLVYGRDRFRLDGGDDVIEAPPLGGISQWDRQRMDAGMALIAERFTRPGQVVCDPVVLDRSSTALAARKHGCTFIGAGKDKSCIDRIWRRLAQEEGAGAA